MGLCKTLSRGCICSVCRKRPDHVGRCVLTSYPQTAWRRRSGGSLAAAGRSSPTCLRLVRVHADSRLLLTRFLFVSARSRWSLFMRMTSVTAEVYLLKGSNTRVYVSPQTKKDVLRYVVIETRARRWAIHAHARFGPIDELYPSADACCSLIG